MDYQDIIDKHRKYEPFFGNWYIKRFVGAGAFAKVFEIFRKDFGDEYCKKLKTVIFEETKDWCLVNKDGEIVEENVDVSDAEKIADKLTEQYINYSLRRGFDKPEPTPTAAPRPERNRE